MSKRLSGLTTLERFNMARSAYEAKKFDTIEDAAKAHKISPATYYNYARKIPSSGALPIASFSPSKMYSQEELDKIIKENQQMRTLLNGDSSAVKSLQDEISKLKNKIVELIMV